MIEIIPSILTNSKTEAKNLISRSEGVAGRVHIDIIDAKFVDNKTIEPSALSDLDTHLLIDYHLMVDDPVNWLEQCVRGQADRVIGQIEMMSDQIEFVKKCQEHGFKVGFGLDLKTDVSAIDETILKDLDVVLIMSVKAGWGGQEFHPEVLEKVTKLVQTKLEDNTPFKICVDGGETLNTLDETKLAGADEVIVGRRLFEGDLKTNIEKFTKAANE